MSPDDDKPQPPAEPPAADNRSVPVEPDIEDFLPIPAAKEAPAPQAAGSETAGERRPRGDAEATQEEYDEEADEAGHPKMTLGQHLDELRRRLIYAAIGLVAVMAVALIFGKQLIRLIEYPYNVAMQEAGREPQLAMTGLTDAFSTYLRVSFYAALVVAAPWIVYQLWMFVAAGLYPNERRYVNRSIPFSVLLFLVGAAFGVQVSIPAMKFFVTFANSLGVQPIVTLDNYISFMTNLLLVFGLIFEVPLVVLVLAKVGLVNMRMLNRYRRHVVVAMAVFAAVFAPPDAMSMILMILPMWLLYEGGILLAWLLVFRKKAKQIA